MSGGHVHDFAAVCPACSAEEDGAAPLQEFDVCWPEWARGRIIDRAERVSARSEREAIDEAMRRPAPEGVSK